MNFIKIDSSKREEINNLYNSVRGKGFCIWNEYYPTYEEIDKDIKNDGLYALVDNNIILGSVSINLPREFDDFEGFKVHNDIYEIGRIAISLDFQGKGYSKLLIEYIIKVLKEKKAKAIHLAVAKSNTPAIKLYKSFGFEFLGERTMFEHDYFLCELIL